MAKRFCPFENDYFPTEQFRAVGGTLVHDVEPCHRASDGIPVQIKNGVVVPLPMLSVEALPEAAADE